MIKTLKLSDKSVRRFKSHKSWKYSTLEQGDSLILEQGDNIPIFLNTDFKLVTEQNKNDFDLNVKKGKNISVHFFDIDSKYYDSEKEPINYDGSYQRVVYTSVKHLFYNNYGVGQTFDESHGDFESVNISKNPLYVFGQKPVFMSQITLIQM